LLTKTTQILPHQPVTNILSLCINYNFYVLISSPITKARLAMSEPNMGKLDEGSASKFLRPAPSKTCLIPKQKIPPKTFPKSGECPERTPKNSFACT